MSIDYSKVNETFLVQTGLFQRVICLGGGLINSWTVTNEPKELAFRFGKAVGIDTQDTTELINKLKEVETEKLVHANEALTKEDVGLV